jgi:hypothetical protein
MTLFKKNKDKGKPSSDVPGYGGRWFFNKEDSPKGSRKKKRPSEKLPNYPVDTGFVYYDDE